MCITKTSINKTVIMNILKACRNVQNGYCVDHVRNRKGQAIFAVRRVKDMHGKVGFEITNRKGENMAKLICQGWAINNHNEYNGFIGNEKNGNYSGKAMMFLVARVLYNYQIVR